MDFELHPLEAADIPYTANIFFDAFQNDLHSLSCFPRTPAVSQWWEKLASSELHEPGAHWLKITLKATGELVGMAKWAAPKREADADPSEALVSMSPPEGGDTKAFEESFSVWARKHRELMENRPHWYLEMCAVRSAYQGKGVGSRLIRWGLERADQEGVESYLDSTPAGVPLYERLGFRRADVTDTFLDNDRVKSTWYRNVHMIRPAQSKS